MVSTEDCEECMRLQKEESEATVEFVNARDSLEASTPEERQDRKTRLYKAEAALKGARDRWQSHRSSHLRSDV